MLHYPSTSTYLKHSLRHMTVTVSAHITQCYDLVLQKSEDKKNLGEDRIGLNSIIYSPVTFAIHSRWEISNQIALIKIALLSRSQHLISDGVVRTYFIATKHDYQWEWRISSYLIFNAIKIYNSFYSIHNFPDKLFLPCLIFTLIKPQIRFRMNTKCINQIVTEHLLSYLYHVLHCSSQTLAHISLFALLWIALKSRSTLTLI